MNPQEDNNQVEIKRRWTPEMKALLQQLLAENASEETICQQLHSNHHRLKFRIGDLAVELSQKQEMTEQQICELCRMSPKDLENAKKRNEQPTKKEQRKDTPKKEQRKDNQSLSEHDQQILKQLDVIRNMILQKK